MGKLTVFGGSKPHGTVGISGSKNEVLPVIFSSILMHGKTEIDNVPDILDVEVALSIIRCFGARIERLGDRLNIDTSSLTYAEPPLELTSRLRASTYLIGSMLSRFGRCPIDGFGGCSFSPLPLDMHISALEALSGRVEGRFAAADRLVGADIRFRCRSIGATVNALLLSVSAKGESRIFGYAREKHVMNLISFLRSAGADITLDEEKITVVGRALSGGKIRISPDVLEGASYLNISALTGGEIFICDIGREDLSPLFPVYKSLGFEILRDSRGICLRRASEPIPTHIVAEPEPGFPTDLQPIFAPLIAYSASGSIEDRVFPSRFGYLSELSKHGVISKGAYSSVKIFHSTPRAASSSACDLRGGMAVLLAAICADGVSEISSAELILRGYDSLIAKLCALSLDVRYE
jgi:UDP-N-acetylglucosamine 1-carboxyvinyltransferase